VCAKQSAEIMILVFHIARKAFPLQGLMPTILFKAIGEEQTVKQPVNSEPSIKLFPI